MFFIEAKNEAELNEKVSLPSFAIVEKVCGGYLIFNTEYEHVAGLNQV